MRQQLFAMPLALCLSVAAPLTSLAATSMLSGVFDAAQPSASRIPQANCTARADGYQEAFFTVPVDGEYLYFDAFRDLVEYGAPPVSVRIYADAFDPARPDLNLLSEEPERWQAPRVRLSAGKEYVLVVQHECQSAEGAWAVGFDGPGELRSEQKVLPPAFTSGRFADNDPVTTQISCGLGGVQSRYRQYGPLRVARSGTYYYAQTLFAVNDTELASVCLQVYTASADGSAANSVPLVNLTGHGTVELQAGEDYYLVVRTYDDLGRGKYQFVFVPPAPFRINAGLSDAWHDPDTPGQGVFLDVLDQRNLLFLGWFTYSADAPPGLSGPPAWMTAQGRFAGTHAELDLTWTQAPAAAAGELPQQHVDGDVTLDFFDCRSGRLRYAWGGTADKPAYAGTIPLRRVSDDSVALCETLYAGPASPGPL